MYRKCGSQNSIPVGNFDSLSVDLLNVLGSPATGEAAIDRSCSQMEMGEPLILFARRELCEEEPASVISLEDDESTT
jgi:hypothetical protein